MQAFSAAMSTAIAQSPTRTTGEVMTELASALRWRHPAWATRNQTGGSLLVATDRTYPDGRRVMFCIETAGAGFRLVDARTTAEHADPVSRGRYATGLGMTITAGRATAEFDDLHVRKAAEFADRLLTLDGMLTVTG